MAVSKSVEDTFSFLNRCESHLRFIPRMTSLNQTSEGTFGQVGTTLDGMLNYFGLRIPVQYEIAEMEPNQKLTMNGKMGPVLFRDGYILQRKDKGTEIKFWLDLMPKGWAKLFTPLMGLIGKIHAWETLRNLKRELAKMEIASQKEVMT
jgi:hypothetical protein